MIPLKLLEEEVRPAVADLLFAALFHRDQVTAAGTDPGAFGGEG